MDKDERKPGIRKSPRRPARSSATGKDDFNQKADASRNQALPDDSDIDYGNTDSLSSDYEAARKITFQELGIREDIIEVLTSKGYKHPTPIQAKTIPVILQGRDVIGQAETGSGKTAACAIPAIQTLDMSLADVQVLVLTPTRELAIQYLTEITSIGGPLGVLPFVVYGGFDKSIQQVKIRAGVHILVATPGRLIDLVYNGTLELENVKLLIVDEADEMLDMGFLDDVKFIKKCLVHEHQTLLFSATMPPPIKALAGKYLTDPTHIKLNRDQVTPQSLRHCYVEVEEDAKADCLVKLVKDENISQAIIFCNTRQKVTKVHRELRRRLPGVAYLHGGLEQRVRTHTMEMIRMEEIKFVVTTDVMARGIDVKNLSHIIHYDLPKDPEVYIHRSGRTGRQGREGVAVAFITHREKKLFGRMMIRASAEATRIGDNAHSASAGAESDAGSKAGSRGPKESRGSANYAASANARSNQRNSSSGFEKARKPRPADSARPAESRPVESRPAESRPMESTRPTEAARPMEREEANKRPSDNRPATPGNENRVKHVITLRPDVIAAEKAAAEAAARAAEATGQAQQTPENVAQPAGRSVSSPQDERPRAEKPSRSERATAPRNENKVVHVITLRPDVIAAEKAAAEAAQAAKNAETARAAEAAKEVVIAQNKSERAARSSRIAQKVLPKKSGQSGRDAQAAKNLQTVKAVQPVKTTQQEKTAKPERAAQQEKPAQPVKVMQPEKAVQPAKIAQPEKAVQPDKRAQSDRTESPARGRVTQSEKTAVPDKNNRPERGKRPERQVHQSKIVPLTDGPTLAESLAGLERSTRPKTNGLGGKSRGPISRTGRPPKSADSALPTAPAKPTPAKAAPAKPAVTKPTPAKAEPSRPTVDKTVPAKARASKSGATKPSAASDKPGSAGTSEQAVEEKKKPTRGRPRKRPATPKPE
ncbi:MAG: hypothetical protein CVV64_20230 [Candidatus Wallbacteria bacterium HGW-Wallbacteria-1]|uniref:DEAD/DEAH box helicase n=1 Tax=Candidatus Wallbacteria bacterium HGW-Wallbacteria-1 TaxID=2013854 RepID=A0A2N1PID2_9BACT|nr:MAG: hypothetical protein CVV64_20230 [Candidatus Wallbacteria bacterium HGW-Wallbacteria-1]